jgi:thioredoxin 1
MIEPKQITDSTFATDVLESESLVLVDFWAPWCGPCRMVTAVVDEIANEYGNQLTVVKMNTDVNPKIASDYGIRSIPTLMLFKDGKRIETVIGAVPKSTLANVINNCLKS